MLQSRRRSSCKKCKVGGQAECHTLQKLTCLATLCGGSRGLAGLPFPFEAGRLQLTSRRLPAKWDTPALAKSTSREKRASWTSLPAPVHSKPEVDHRPDFAAISLTTRQSSALSGWSRRQCEGSRLRWSAPLSPTPPSCQPVIARGWGAWAGEWVTAWKPSPRPPSATAVSPEHIQGSSTCNNKSHCLRSCRWRDRGR